MFDPVTFGIAFIIVCAVHVYIRERRREREDEFDGGWRHENDTRITKILSPHIRNVKGDDE
jgi:hypothetical protein